MLREDLGARVGLLVLWKTHKELGIWVLGPDNTGLQELLAKCSVHGKDSGTSRPLSPVWALSPDTSTQGGWPETLVLPKLSVNQWSQDLLLI